MFPYISIGSLKLPTYLIMVIIGMISYTIVTLYLLEKKEKYEPKTVNKLLIISVVSFIILYVSALIMNSIFHSIEKGYIVIGGITWLGGVVVTLPVTVLLIYKFVPELRGKALNTFSLMIPGLVLAHGFGRIGCFLGGCCFGKVTDSFLGIVFPEGSPAAHLYPSIDGSSLPVLPTQLYEALFEFLLFVVLMIFYKKLKTKNIEVYGISYSIFRFCLEFLRGDSRGETGFQFSPAQFLSIVLIIYSVLIILFKKKLIFKKIHSKIEKDINNTKNEKEDNLINDLTKLYEIYKSGGLTEEEYTKIKVNYVDKIANK